MKNFWHNLPKPILAVAPMDGVTDNAFRSILKENGADVVYSEFVSVDGIYHALQHMEAQMAYEEMQRPYVCQIFGKDPELFKHAASVVAKKGADGVDINFGCPSKRVVKHGSGVKLMTNLDLVYDIVDATIQGADDLPVSIKIRAGINMKLEDQESGATQVEKMTAVQMMEKIKDLDFQCVMIHGRTYEQGFIGDLDIEQIKKIKEILPGKLVLVNGGITTPERAKEVLEQTGADGIGVGRGVMGKPWLMQQIKDYLETGAYTEPTWEEKKKIINKHTKLMFENKGNHGMLEIRKHLGWYIKGIPDASKFRAELMQVQTPKEVFAILEKL